MRFSDVAEVARIPIASIQHYFPTIAELRRAGVGFNVREELSGIQRVLGGIDDPWEQIETIIRRSIGENERERRLGWALWLEYWGAATRDEDIAVDAREVAALWVATAREAISRGVELGQFTTHGGIDEAARDLHSIIDGYGVRLGATHTDADAADVLGACERLARCLLGLPEQTAPSTSEDPS